ncbi:MAG: imidazoleglycerol-phosphate dehydratase HisB [Chlorobiaceae bacterium]|nr:imidazoleglycerol-phosphate dehydratase HisB [Chlorobiaceae bacterium]
MPEQENTPFRTATVTRTTKETEIRVTLSLDGRGISSVNTGVVFFDHMLTNFSRHSGLDLSIECKGDLDVDDHHTIEDIAIVLGKAITDALGDKQGIQRYGWSIIPMDEALARCALDLGGRSYCVFNAEFNRPVIQGFSTEMVKHFFVSLAESMKANIHLSILEGENTHHKIEALFKSFAYALKAAVAVTGSGIPSTKGKL